MNGLNHGWGVAQAGSFHLRLRVSKHPGRIFAKASNQAMRCGHVPFAGARADRPGGSVEGKAGMKHVRTAYGTAWFRFVCEACLQNCGLLGIEIEHDGPIECPFCWAPYRLELVPMPDLELESEQDADTEPERTPARRP